MKICHVTNHLPYYHDRWGGAERAAYRLACSHAEMGHAVTVLGVPSSSLGKDKFRFIGVPTLDKYFSRFFGPIKRLGLDLDPLAYVNSIRAFKKIKPDIVHFHNFRTLSFSVVKAAKQLGIPTVLSVYDYWYFCLNEDLMDKKGNICREYNSSKCFECEPQVWKRPFITLRGWLFSIFLSWIDCFVVLSGSSEDILREMGLEDKRIRKVPLSHDISKYESYGLKEAEEGLILFIGWIQARKGLHVVLEALPKIRKKYASAKLVAVGTLEDEKYANRLKRRAEELSVSDEFCLVGKVSDKELSSLVKRANVIVIPEQWENMSPLVLIEAMSYAKPVVASCLGGIPEFVEDGISGCLAKHNDPEDFAKKILEVFSDRVRAQKIGQAARSVIIEKCDERKNLEKMERVYREIIQG